MAKKLTTSLTGFKERQCTMAIVLDIRSNRKDVTEYPVKARFTIDRRSYYYPIGGSYSKLDFSEICNVQKSKSPKYEEKKRLLETVDKYKEMLVNLNPGHELTLVVQTMPWEDESVELNYTETVMWKDNGGAPQWVAPVPPVVDEDDGLVTLNVKGGYDLSCSFTLDAPQGWLWYAELEPLTEGASNYITFSDGTTMTSGSVGQASTLYFHIATGATTQHQSRLKLYVRTPSGDKSLEVKILKCIISLSV